MSKIKFLIEDAETGEVSEPMAKEEIADMLGCSVSAIRQAEMEGYNLLRRYRVYRVPSEDFCKSLESGKDENTGRMRDEKINPSER